MKLTKLSKKQCELGAKDLREFGYPDVTAEMVKEKTDKLFAGDYTDIDNVDIIAMFLKRMLEEAGVEFPERKEK